MKNKAQQEMVGFVLIVIIVIIAILIFLVFSLRNNAGENSSLEATNMLDAIFKMTTECAPVFEPQYEDYGELFKSCYRGERCANLNQDVCAYLNESLSKVLVEIAKSEAAINALALDFYTKEGEGLLRISKGNCSGESLSAMKSINADSQILNVKLKICKED